MTASSAGDLVAIAARLRAAGCVFAEEEVQLLAGTASSAEELAVMVERRAAGFPLEHVLGWAEFCGLRIVLSDGVFVPRRRSEFLVRQAVAVARASRPDGQARTAVVDLCCGSGAVGLAVASVLHNADLYVTDIEPTAVACARANVAPVGGHIYQGDLYDSLPARLRGQVDLLVVNAPYVPTDEMALMPPEARLHEPAIALDGGPDGVTIHRRVAAGAPGWLAPDGHLLIETSTRQAELTAAAMTASGLAATVATDDDLEATVVIGARTGPRHSDGTV